MKPNNKFLTIVPDFRSPGTGLYSNLARLNLPYAEAVFDIGYFRQHPEPFYVLAKELYPGKFFPTISHAFISLLAKKGLLQMLFTQNIDCLERAAGVPAAKIVEAHGSFATQRCIECNRVYPDDKMKEKVFAGEVPRCERESCGGLVKPDIVFFGEGLPSSFSENAPRMGAADVVLIIGTSLTVFPFAKLPELTSTSSPRVLFNMEKVGSLGSRADDVLQLGSCDDGICKLADELGWREELDKLWREIVGDEEADRQVKSNEEKKWVSAEKEDEMERLTQGIVDGLKLDEGYSPEDDEEKPVPVKEEVEAEVKKEDTTTTEKTGPVLVTEEVKEEGRKEDTKDTTTKKVVDETPEPVKQAPKETESEPAK